MSHAIHPFAHLHAWQRLGLAGGIGLFVALALQAQHLVNDWESQLLISWLAAGSTYITVLILGLGRLNAHLSRWRAQRDDPGANAIYLLLLVTVFVSLAGILLISAAANNTQGLARGEHILLALSALAMNWLLIQAVFTLHYARLYYAPDGSTAETNDTVGGLIFPGGTQPGYTDFAYFALVIGMTSQTADINIANTPMRRLAMLHGLTSFAYNILVLAMTLNLLAGALG
jgi:uncharacterized membrane protein